MPSVGSQLHNSLQPRGFIRFLICTTRTNVQLTARELVSYRCIVLLKLMHTVRASYRYRLHNSPSLLFSPSARSNRLFCLSIHIHSTVSPPKCLLSVTHSSKQPTAT